MRVQLTPDNATRLKQIASDSEGLFEVHGIVNLVMARWLEDRPNAEKPGCGMAAMPHDKFIKLVTKACDKKYARPQKTVSRK